MVKIEYFDSNLLGSSGVNVKDLLHGRLGQH